MCLKIGGCFGLHAGNDDDYFAPPPQYHGNGYPTPRTSAAGAEAGRKASNDVRREPTRGVPAGAARGWHGHVDTAGVQHKAAYAGAYETSKQPAGAARGWHGNADTTGVQQKAVYAGADEASRQHAAWNGRVVAADGARGGAHGYYHYEREQPAHREDAADLHYPAAAAAATADRERY